MLFLSAFLWLSVFFYVALVNPKARFERGALGIVIYFAAALWTLVYVAVLMLLEVSAEACTE